MTEERLSRHTAMVLDLVDMRGIRDRLVREMETLDRTIEQMERAVRQLELTEA